MQSWTAISLSTLLHFFYQQNTDKQHSETELLLLEIDSSSCK